MKKYYEIINIDNDKPYAYCSLGINWCPKDFINDKCLDGYIVQRVKITNIGIDIPDANYYEAWKVENEKYVEHTDNKADDTFNVGNDLIINDYIILSLGKTGYIKFSAEVYWISKMNELYGFVDKWKEGRVREAGELKSILVKDCKELKNCVPIFKRPDFIHEVSFADKETIQRTIEKTYSERIKRKDKEFYIELQEMLKNTK